jgi:photosystem II stability/assembly factor-like uncharacterized protein
MTHSNDSQRPRRTLWQLTAASLVLLASVGWAQHVSAADPRSERLPVGGKIGAVVISALAIDPESPATLDAGTGCAGVLKSFDGADNWETVSTGLPPDTHGWIRVDALVIDPITPTTLYAGSYGSGVFRSQDGGATWQRTGLATHYVLGLAIDPTSPLTVYAATSGGVFRTRDGGGSWIGINAGITRMATELAVNPTTPSTVYAGPIFKPACSAA